MKLNTWMLQRILNRMAKYDERIKMMFEIKLATRKMNNTFTSTLHLHEGEIGENIQNNIRLNKTNNKENISDTII